MNALAALIARIDNRMNPIVVKELRQAVKSRFVVGVMMFFLIFELFVVVGFAFGASFNAASDAQFTAGREAFLALFSILMFISLTFVPMYTVVRMTGERSEANIDLFFITTLRPSQIVWGKLFAGLMVTILLYSVCTPFITFTYLMRGVDLTSAALVLSYGFLIISAVIMVSIFIGALPIVRALRLIMFFIMIFMMYFSVSMLGGLILVFGAMGGIPAGGLLTSAIPWGSPLFWGTLGSLFALVAVGMELLFVLSVAMLCPPSANRAPPVRLSILTAWLLGGAISLWWALEEYDQWYIYMWMFFSVIVGCICFLAGVSERDQWGPRVARAIPQKPLIRLLVFPFYSGAVNGIVFSLILVLGSLGFTYGWTEHHMRILEFFTNTLGWTGTPPSNPMRLDTSFTNALPLMSILFLYVWCYGLSARLYVNRMRGSQVRSIHTWIVAMLLMALLSFLPFVAGWIIEFRAEVQQRDMSDYWLLANPIMGGVEAAQSFSQAKYYWRFIAVWSIVAGVLAAPWLVRQIKQFRPLVGSDPS